METNLDSVLDRLRVLEEQMEKGIPMAAVQSLPGYAGMNDGIPVQPTQAAPSAPEKKPEKAAPEDLQRIKENWKNIVMQTQGMFKTFLTTAVPKYNGNTGENKLYVEFSNDLAQTCVDDLDKKQLLEDLILQMTGKTVEVEMLLKKTNMHQDLAEISVEENQKALEEKEFTAAAGGGAVEVTVSGKKEVTKVKLAEEVVDPDDVEMLEDLIMAATNEALRKMEAETQAVMSKLTDGLGGGFPF